MKKLFLFALFTSSTLAPAQEFAIKLNRDWKQNRNLSREQELYERLTYLESAVWELQMKVFELQSKKPISIFPPPERINRRAWYCEIKAFGNHFDAWGPTELEARTAVVNHCTRRYFGSTCTRPRVKCEANT